MTIEQRLTNLENLVCSLIKKIDNDKFYNDSDKAGIIKINFEQDSDISDNRAGIEESFEATLANSDDIADVRTALEEVYEMINTEE